jgi:hypothetical protein
MVDTGSHPTTARLPAEPPLGTAGSRSEHEPGLAQATFDDRRARGVRDRDGRRRGFTARAVPLDRDEQGAGDGHGLGGDRELDGGQALRRPGRRQGDVRALVADRNQAQRAVHASCGRLDERRFAPGGGGEPERRSWRRPRAGDHEPASRPNLEQAGRAAPAELHATAAQKPDRPSVCERAGGRIPPDGVGDKRPSGRLVDRGAGMAGRRSAAACDHEPHTSTGPALDESPGTTRSPKMLQVRPTTYAASQGAPGK